MPQSLHRNLRKFGSRKLQSTLLARLVVGAAVSISLAGTPSAHAASGTWNNGGGDNNWLTATNWSAGVPGTTSGYASTDSATFSTAGSGTIGLGGSGATVNIQNINFGVGTGNAGAFTIGDSGEILNLTAGAVVTVGTGVTSTQKLGVSGTAINLANGSVAQAYSLINNSTTGGAKLNVDADIIYNNTAATTTVTLNGSNGGTISGSIIDSGAGGTLALTKNGTGTWTLTGSNVYAGATSISGGVLDLGGGTATGDIFSGSTLVLGSSATFAGGVFNYTRTGTNIQSFNGYTINAGASSVNATTGTVRLGGATLARAYGGTIDFTGNVTTSTANTAAGILGGWATFGGSSWAVGNGATTPITGLSSYTASVAGTTTPGTTANVDVQASNTTAWNTQSVNSLRFNTATATTLTLASGQTLTDSSGGILVTSAVGNNVTTIAGGTLAGIGGNSELIVIQNNTSNELVINSVITGVANNGLTKAGPGTLTLGGTNTYLGRTYVTGGTLKLANASAFGGSSSTAAIATASGTMIDLNGTSITFGAVRAINVFGGFTNSNATTATWSAAWTGASSQLGAVNTINGTGDITFTGGISSGRLVKNGNNTLTLGSATANTSTTLVANSGTVILNSSATDGGLRGIDINGNTLTVNTGGLVRLGANEQILSAGAGLVGIYGGTFDINSKTETVAGLQIGSTDGSTAGTVSSTGGTGALTTTGTVANFGTNRILATNGTASAILAGAATVLNKTTTGTVTLSGVNTYTGGTTISAGTLLANTAATGSNSATGTGAVSVASTGTLGGTGQIRPTGTNAITVASGGFLAPGTTGTGTLTIDSGGSTAANILTLASGASLKFDLGTGGTFASPGVSDLLVIANSAVGDVVFNANTLDLLGTGGVGTYKLFDGLASATEASDSWVGLTLGGTSGREIVSGLVVTNLASGLTETLFLGDGVSFGAAGDIYLVVVPEPSTVGSVLLGLGFLIGIHRLRRQQI